jgi:hypothetical protein
MEQSRSSCHDFAQYYQEGWLGPEMQVFSNSNALSRNFWIYQIFIRKNLLWGNTGICEYIKTWGNWTKKNYFGKFRPYYNSSILGGIWWKISKASFWSHAWACAKSNSLGIYGWWCLTKCTLWYPWNHAWKWYWLKWTWKATLDTGTIDWQSILRRESPDVTHSPDCSRTSHYLQLLNL